MYSMDVGKTWTESDAYCQSIFGTKLSTIFELTDQNEIILLRNTLENDGSIDSNDNLDMWIG